MSASQHPASHVPRPISPLTRENAECVTWEDASAIFDLHPASPAKPRDVSYSPAADVPDVSPGADVLPTPELAAIEDVGELFSRYRRYVATIGRRILGSNRELDDLIQDVFVATVKDVHKVKDPARLRAWLATVTTRMAHRHRFRNAINATRNHDNPDELINLASEDGPSPESTADLSGNIQNVLSLPDELRTPWLLKHVEGLTLHDVAEQCACSPSTAARRIQTASCRITRRR